MRSLYTPAGCRGCCPAPSAPAGWARWPPRQSQPPAGRHPAPPPEGEARHLRRRSCRHRRRRARPARRAHARPDPPHLAGTAKADGQVLDRWAGVRQVGMSSRGWWRWPAADAIEPLAALHACMRQRQAAVHHSLCSSAGSAEQATSQRLLLRTRYTRLLLSS